MWFQLVYRCLLSLSEHCNVPSHATPLALSRRYFLLSGRAPYLGRVVRERHGVGRRQPGNMVNRLERNLKSYLKI